eukprot:8906021-Heterocapsa_arctica.AAC.1
MMLTNLPKAPLTFPFQLFLGSLKEDPSSMPCAAPWKSGLLFPTACHLCAARAWCRCHFVCSPFVGSMVPPSAERQMLGPTGDHPKFLIVLAKREIGPLGLLSGEGVSRLLSPRRRHNFSEVRSLWQLVDPSPDDVGREKKVRVEPRVGGDQRKGGFRGTSGRGSPCDGIHGQVPE